MKKGFTLIEVLAVIVILGLVMTIGVTVVSGIRDSSIKKAQKIKEEEIVAGAILYGQENRNIFGNEECGTDEDFCNKETITVGNLLDKDYVESKEGMTSDGKKELTNSVTGTSMRGVKVRVYMKNNRVYARIEE